MKEYLGSCRMLSIHSALGHIKKNQYAAPYARNRSLSKAAAERCACLFKEDPKQVAPGGGSSQCESPDWMTLGLGSDPSGENESS